MHWNYPWRCLDRLGRHPHFLIHRILNCRFHRTTIRHVHNQHDLKTLTRGMHYSFDISSEGETNLSTTCVETLFCVWIKFILSCKPTADQACRIILARTGFILLELLEIQQERKMCCETARSGGKRDAVISSERPKLTVFQSLQFWDWNTRASSLCSVLYVYIFKFTTYS